MGCPLYTETRVIVLIMSRSSDETTTQDILYDINIVFKLLNNTVEGVTDDCSLICLKSVWASLVYLKVLHVKYVLE